MYKKLIANFKIFEKLPYKFIFFLSLIIISPTIFKFLDHSFQKTFGLNKFINVIDFIFLGFVTFCFLKKDKFKNYLSLEIGFLVLYLLLARLSILFSQGDIHHRAFYDLFKAYILIAIYALFVSPSFRKHQKIIIKIFFILFFTYTVFETSIGIMQFILQKPIGFTFLNEPIFSHDLGSCKIRIDKAFFLLKFLPSQNSELLRAHGTFIHPNLFAGFLNVSSLLSLYLIYKSKKKFLFFLFLIFQLIVLILTFSRAAFAAFIITSSLFFFLMVLKKYDVKKMLFVFLTIMFCILAIGSKYLVERGFLGSFFQSQKAKELNILSAKTRDSLKDASINMIKKKPLLGIGFRNFLIKRNEYSKNEVERAYVHNIYLLLGAETGILTLLIFMAMIFISLINIIRSSLTPSQIISICMIVSFLLIGFFDHYPISSTLGRLVLFLNIAFLNFSKNRKDLKLSKSLVL